MGRSKRGQSRRATGFLPQGGLRALDPEVQSLLDIERERQIRKIILIASESICPPAVREALVSDFTNIYAEGYPSTRMRTLERDRLGEMARHLSFFRRYSDRRYYKGTEYADFVETLAVKRVAELFATEDVPAEKIHANVQPLAGAAANNAVYNAFVDPGGVVMGMSLTHGGHLTHGSPYNRSGRHFSIVSYTADPETGEIDFDALRRMAEDHTPQMVIAGYSAHPWDIDWGSFREVCDSVGAILLADVSHIAGLIAGGICRSPLPYADVVTFTTHKTLCGPRGAVILTTDPEKARAVDVGVFPGEQGGPHVNQIAAKAVAFDIARTEGFRALQGRIAENAVALCESFRKRGYSIAYGGTNTHLFLLNLQKHRGRAGVGLNAEIAARMLDIAGITCNKNAIPGDASAANPGGLRFGTTFVSQRGMGPEEMEDISDLVDRILSEAHSFRVRVARGPLGRARVPFGVLRGVASDVEALQSRFMDGGFEPRLTYPHFVHDGESRQEALRISGERAEAFLQGVLSCDLASLEEGWMGGSLLDEEGEAIAEVSVREDGLEAYLLRVREGSVDDVKLWLRAHSDGYLLFEPGDLHAKVEGPVVIEEVPGVDVPSEAGESRVDLSKTFFVGQTALLGEGGDGRKEEFLWTEPEDPPRRTPLHGDHLKLTRPRNIVEFAGYEMPVQYTSILEEHRAVRETAGLFDVSHMGVIEVSGKGATTFLNTVTTNFLTPLRIGMCQYNYVLDPHGAVMDDLMAYRLDRERYMVVVNAVNQRKILAWFQAVNSRQFLIDVDHPGRAISRPVKIREMKDTRIDLALQGPCSLEALLRVVDGDPDRSCLEGLKRSHFVSVRIAGADVIIANSGYTGEPLGFELYVHPGDASKIWNLILDAGEEIGVRPTGLGARDSTRTQAGFPLWGQELAGSHNITPMEAGYGAFVKYHKPFFVGRRAALARDEGRTMEVIRFLIEGDGGRMVKPDAPVMDRNGRVVGAVTSCARIDGGQVGLAWVLKQHADPGTTLGVYALPRPEKVPPGKSPLELEVGDRVALHEEAVVVERFYKGA